MIFINSNNCINNLLKVISILQDNSINQNINNCSKNYLGPSINSGYNTRVISLYKRDGSIFSASFLDDDNTQLTSSLFRIANVNDGYCTLLILNEDNNLYYSTNQFLTIQINCICAVRCIIDTTVNNL